MLDAMCADFEQLPVDARSRLLNMLCQSGIESAEWWRDIPVGEDGLLYRGFETI